MRETIRFKALHTPAFVIDTDDNVWANRANRSDEFTHLSTGFKITSKQNHPTCIRMRETAFVVCGQIETCQINNHRAQ